MWEYINRFGEFTSYQHKVFITYKGKVYTMPINLSTINAFYGKNFRPAEAAAFLEAEIARDFIAEPKNLEEKAISVIGRPLYEAFIQGIRISSGNTIRVSCRRPSSAACPSARRTMPTTSMTPGQGVPKDGYFSIFKRMLDNPLITVKLNCDYESIKARIFRRLHGHLYRYARSVF